MYSYIVYLSKYVFLQITSSFFSPITTMTTKNFPLPSSFYEKYFVNWRSIKLRSAFPEHRQPVTFPAVFNTRSRGRYCRDHSFYTPQRVHTRLTSLTTLVFFCSPHIPDEYVREDCQECRARGCSSWARVTEQAGLVFLLLARFLLHLVH